MKKFHQILRARSSAGEVWGWKVLTLIKIYLIDFLQNTRALPLTKFKHFHLVLLNVPHFSSAIVKLLSCLFDLLLMSMQSIRTWLTNLNNLSYSEPLKECERPIWFITSDRSSMSHNLCLSIRLSVPSVKSCLDQSIFIKQTSFRV